MVSKTPPAMMATVFACGCRLTVDEHIWFYGRLKGLSAAAVGPEQDLLLQDVGLVPKRHAQTRHLSGEPPGPVGGDEAGVGAGALSKGSRQPEEIQGTQGKPGAEAKVGEERGTGRGGSPVQDWGVALKSRPLSPPRRDATKALSGHCFCGWLPSRYPG